MIQCIWFTLQVYFNEYLWEKIDTTRALVQPDRIIENTGSFSSASSALLHWVDPLESTATQNLFALLLGNFVSWSSIKRLPLESPITFLCSICYWRHAFMFSQMNAFRLLILPYVKRLSIYFKCHILDFLGNTLKLVLSIHCAISLTISQISGHYPLHQHILLKM